MQPVHQGINITGNLVRVSATSVVFDRTAIFDTLCWKYFDIPVSGCVCDLLVYHVLYSLIPFIVASLIRLKDNICLIWKPAILLCQHTSLPVSSCVYAPSQRAFHYHHYSKWSHISLKNVSQFGRSNALKLCCQHTVAQHLSKALVTQA